MFKPPGSLHRTRWPVWFAAATFACSEKTGDCMAGFAMSGTGKCEPVVGADTGGTNTPPTAPSAALHPQAPREGGSDLQCVIAAPSVDVDGDNVHYTVSWSRNGDDAAADQQRTWPDDTVSGGRLIDGDTWTCQIAPSDGAATGPSATVSAVIGTPHASWDERHHPLEEADHILTGESNGYCAGGALTPAGDMDMDGRMDFLIADTWWSNPDTGDYAGKAYLILGRDLSGNPLINLSDAAWAFEGEQGKIEDDPDCEDADTRCGGDWAAHSISGGMDGDGDGSPDLLISAYRSDEGGINRGKLVFFSGADLGPAGTRSIGSADVQIHGENDGDKMGHSTHWVGDVDGDGLMEAITGSAYQSSNGNRAGRVYLIPGTAFEQTESMGVMESGALAWDGETPEDRLGQQTGRLGDIDGDGLDDFVMSAMRNQENGVGPAGDEFRGSGKTYVILGADVASMEPGSIGSVADAAAAWVGENGGDAIGYSGGTIGDFDGDGLPDMTVGSHGYSSVGSQNGKIYIVTAQDVAEGGTRSLSEASYGFVGEGEYDWAGKGASGAGDFDRDGRADLLIGAMGHSTDDVEFAGRAYLVLSASMLPGTHEVGDADYIFSGERAWDGAGAATLGPGDLNGDGLPDLLIGAWQGDSHETATGKVYVFLNP